jgi:hypothetical protein
VGGKGKRVLTIDRCEFGFGFDCDGDGCADGCDDGSDDVYDDIDISGSGRADAVNGGGYGDCDDFAVAGAADDEHAYADCVGAGVHFGAGNGVGVDHGWDWSAVSADVVEYERD